MEQINWFDGDFSVIEVLSALSFLLASIFALKFRRYFLCVGIPFFLFLEEISYGLIFVHRGRFFNFAGERIDSFHDFIVVLYDFNQILFYGCVAIGLIVFLRFKPQAGQVRFLKEWPLVMAVFCILAAQLIDVVLRKGAYVYETEESLEFLSSILLNIWVLKDRTSSGNV